MTEHAVGSQVRRPKKAVEPTAVVSNDLMPDQYDEDAVLKAMEESVHEEDESGPAIITLTVPKRLRMKVLCKADLDYDLFTSWMRRATNKKTQEVDYMKLALPVLSHLCVGILFDGKHVRYQGEDVTLAHPRMHEMLGVPKGATGLAIKKMWKLDGHAIQAMRVVIGECGYTVDGDVVEVDEEENPLAG